MIKVCHVTSVHSIQDARVFYKECLSLTKLYEVFLIAPNVKDKIEKGVHVQGVSLPSSRLQRVLCLKRVYKKAIEVNASVYHFHDPELMWIGLKLKRKGKKVVFDSHEDVPQQILDKEYLPSWSRKIISSLYAGFEKFCLKRYDALISVTPIIVERLEKINTQTVMVTNYPSSTQGTFTQCNKQGKYICFAGNVNYTYMHDNVIKALKNINARYLLAGNVDNPSYFEYLKSLEAWNKVDYFGVVSHEKVNEIYQISDVGIVLSDYYANAGYRRGTLGVLKMFEYMMAGLPVVATDMDLWKDIIEGNGCGICVDPHDIDAIVKAVNFYLENPQIAKQAGENGRKAVAEKYNWGTQEVILFNLYKRLIS